MVIAASGVGLEPGQVIEGGQVLSLPEGATLTLIDQDGTPIRLVGPFEGPVGDANGAGEESSVISALANLIAGAGGQRPIVGATRKAEEGCELQARALLDTLE